MKKLINQLKKVEKLVEKDIDMLKGSLYKTKQKYISKKNVKNQQVKYDMYLFTYFKNGKHFSKYIKKDDFNKVNKLWNNYLRYYNEKKKLKTLFNNYIEKLNTYEERNFIDIKDILGK